MCEPDAETLYYHFDHLWNRCDLDRVLTRGGYCAATPTLIRLNGRVRSRAISLRAATSIKEGVDTSGEYPKPKHGSQLAGFFTET